MGIGRGWTFPKGMSPGTSMAQMDPKIQMDFPLMDVWASYRKATLTMDFLGKGLGGDEIGLGISIQNP